MDIAQLHEYTSELERRWQKAGGQGQMESEGDGDGVGHRQRQERKEGRLYHDRQLWTPSVHLSDNSIRTLSIFSFFGQTFRTPTCHHPSPYLCANSGPSTHPFANSGNSELHLSGPNPMGNPPIHAILHLGHPLPSNGTINPASHHTYP